MSKRNIFRKTSGLTRGGSYSQLPISLCLDTSGSMRGHPINELNAGMESADAPITFDFDTTAANIDITGNGKLSSIKEITAFDYNKTSVTATINAMGYKLDYDGNVEGLKEKIKAAGKYEITYKNNKISGDINADTATEVDRKSVV